MYQLIIAEKPSVARDIARALGATKKSEGFIEGANLRVTWAIGHLVALSEPDEIDPRYKKWRAEDLPILPETIPLKVLPKTKSQFYLVKKLMNAKDCESIVCATDAGREGELIFRYLYQMAGCDKPFFRLWISSMTDSAIKEGFSSIKPGGAYDALYDSARCRSEADWLVGMNASRAFSIRYDALLSVGRVQTPTLALLVKRHHEIAAFVPKAYWTVEADFGVAGENCGPSIENPNDYRDFGNDATQHNERRNYGNTATQPADHHSGAMGKKCALSNPDEYQDRGNIAAKPARYHSNGYTGIWKDEQTGEKRVYDEKRANEIVAKVKGADARIESVAREEKTEWPPYLYDLTSLQRDANRLLGFTAQKTLSLAQKLYEEDKLITYPRTDSRFLPRDMAGRTRKAVEKLPPPYAALAEPVLKEKSLPMLRRVFDDTKVTDHHAIIPTDRTADLGKLPKEAAVLYDLIARRMLAAFYDPHRYAAIRVHTRASGELFESLGREVLQIGWKAVYADQKKNSSAKEEQTLPLELTEEQKQTAKGARDGAEQRLSPGLAEKTVYADQKKSGDVKDRKQKDHRIPPGPAEGQKRTVTDARGEAEQTLPPGLSEGQKRTVTDIRVKADKTRPPPKHTDASLLSAMENAGRDLDDEALRETMKNHGLGTPATRAAMIERLLQVKYAERKGRNIQATEKGIRLIAVVPPDIASAETTGRWEKGLSDIAAGGLSPDRFLSGIRALSLALCAQAKNAPQDVRFEKEDQKRKSSKRRSAKGMGTQGESAKRKFGGIGVKCPLCQNGDVLENSKAFYCSRFREGCTLTIWKDAVARNGGPVLTAALVKRVIAEGRVVGSTGVLWHERGKVGFEGKE